MQRHRVSSAADALIYITDCTLATVESMARVKGRKKNEFNRQMAIAQQAIDWMVEFGINPSNTRAADVLGGTGKVVDWVKPFLV